MNCVEVRKQRRQDQYGIAVTATKLLDSFADEFGYLQFETSPTAKAFGLKRWPVSSEKTRFTRILPVWPEEGKGTGFKK